MPRREPIRKLTAEEQEQVAAWWPRLLQISRYVAKMHKMHFHDVITLASEIVCRYARYEYISLEDPRTVTLLLSTLRRDVREWRSRYGKPITLPRDFHTGKLPPHLLAEAQKVNRASFRAGGREVVDTNSAAGWTEVYDFLGDLPGPSRAVVKRRIQGFTDLEILKELGITMTELHDRLAVAGRAWVKDCQ